MRSDDEIAGEVSILHKTEGHLSDSHGHPAVHICLLAYLPQPRLYQQQTVECRRKGNVRGKFVSQYNVHSFLNYLEKMEKN